MKLSFLRKIADKNCELRFQLPSGKTIPIHAHVTEAAVNSKEFTDCGGVKRLDKYITLQLWVSHDIDHRLNSDKFKKIISTINVENDDLEVFFEHEEQTIGRYSCDEVVIYRDYVVFILDRVAAQCLAEDKCLVEKSCCSDTNCCS